MARVCCYNGCTSLPMVNRTGLFMEFDRLFSALAAFRRPDVKRADI